VPWPALIAALERGRSKGERRGGFLSPCGSAVVGVEAVDAMLEKRESASPGAGLELCRRPARGLCLDAGERYRHSQPSASGSPVWSGRAESAGGEASLSRGWHRSVS